MWVEIFVGSRPYSEDFSPGSPVFLSPSKINISKLQFDRKLEGYGFVSLILLLCVTLVNKVDFFFIFIDQATVTIIYSAILLLLLLFFFPQILMSVLRKHTPAVLMLFALIPRVHTTARANLDTMKTEKIA